MKNLEKVLNDNLHILYADPDMKKVFPEGTIQKRKVLGRTYLSFTLSSNCYRVTESASRVSKCNEIRCEKYKNCMVFKNEFTCTVTGKIHKGKR